MTTNQNRLALGAAAIGFALACTLACESSGTSTAEASAAAPATTMNAAAKQSKVMLAVTGMT